MSDPNSKDIDDPNFPAPKCGVCGVPWADHMGIMGVCLCNKALKEDLVNLRKDNAQLHMERDEARRDVCYAEVNGQYGRRYTPQDICEDKELGLLHDHFEWAKKDIGSINQSFEMIRQENEDLENTVISLAKENTLLKMNLKMIQSSRSMLDVYDPMNPNTGEG